MGLKSSPCNCTRAFIRGDRYNPLNPLGWHKVVLNLPAQDDYNPTLPWVFRVDSSRNLAAAFFCTYVDDIRTDDCSKLGRLLY